MLIVSAKRTDSKMSNRSSISNDAFRWCRLICMLSAMLNLPLVPIECFNLEQRQPIVKYGHENTFFGYSLATHTIGESNWANNTKWLLVGAPLDRNLQPKTNQSGALYKCPISTEFYDCEQVITDGRRSFNGSYKDTYELDDELIEPSDDEIKEGQWMGVTVRSQGLGGKVLVCAHRYVTVVNENRYGQGLCYVLDNQLNFEDSYEPCKGRPVTRQHEDYGFCQAGTSGALLDDNSLVMGSPGPFTWRGAIFVTEVGGDYLTRDKFVYYSEHQDASSPVDKYSYLGMAVTGGRYFSENMSYASGAPRSNGHGQVVIFDKTTTNPIPVHMIIDGEQFGSSFGYELITADINGDHQPDLLVAAPFYFSKTEGGAVYVFQNGGNSLPQKPTLKLTGALESRFGYALANIGDLNKDGCEDVAIGSPYEGNGVVSIYLGSRTGLNEKPSQRILASELGRNLPQPIKNFGISLAGNTDLDGNSYMDLLVGAPPTAVVLLARPIINIQTTYRSVEMRNIDPNRAGCRNDVSTNLTCFTFEACCSIDPHEQVSTRINLTYTVEAETFEHHKKFSRVFFDRDNKRSNVMNRSVPVRTDGRLECQMVTGYIKANTRDIQTPIRFRLDYKLEEQELASSPLTRLNPILDQTQAYIEFEATFQKDCGDDDLCESDLRLRADPNLQAEDGKYDFILGNKTELEVTVDVSNFADSAYEAQLFIEHQASVSYIATKKPTNATCNSFNTTLVACSLGNPMLRGTTTSVTIRFDPNSLKREEKNIVFHIFANTTSKLVGKELPERQLVLKVVRRAEMTLRGWVNPEQSFYSGASKLQDSPMELDHVGSPLVHTYSIFNEGPSAAPKVQLDIYLPLTLDRGDGLELQGGTKDKYLQYLEKAPIIETGQGACTVAPEYVNPLKLASKTSDNLRSASYLSAPASLMKWPQHRQQPTAHQMRLNKSQTHTHESVTSQQHWSEQKKTNQETARANRLRRGTIGSVVRLERFMDGREAGSVKGKKQQIVELNCDKLTAHCIKIQCEFYDMPAKTEAQVILNVRLWNSTLVAEYPRVDLVRIMSTANVKIPADFGVEQLETNDKILVETRAYPELLDQQRETYTPLWIIVLAVLGGLVLLALFTYAMWKCGFFKRKRPTDPTLSGNLEKMNEEKPFLAAKSSHNVF
ncbi:integrin alpha-PS1 isoform X1 [Drosophila nasuta]|uniref:integrin alpha-PS1 isoform X1 n=1 Tax=Drosophila nasuta TaxID=42062 RepID=UPI00295ECCBD|nr:integrin alpha-PS1 isoform X1 [Drosophila nasuta]